MRMFTGDKAAGMVGSIAEVFPDAAYQRCTVHFYRNVLARVPKLCLVKSCFRKRARLSFGFRHASFSVSGAGTPLTS